MKLSKLSITFALVVSVHMAVLGFILLQPGCKSSNDPVIVGAPQTAPDQPQLGVMQPPSSTEEVAAPVAEFQEPTRPTWTETPEAAATVEAVAVAPGQAVFEQAQVQTYVVRRGDNLSKIAKKYGVTVNALAQANNMSTKDILRLDQTLVIPSGASVSESAPQSSAAVSAGAPDYSGETQTYVVQRGDSLSKIATKYRTSVRVLQQLNHLSGTLIRQGQKLSVPANGGAAAASNAPAAKLADGQTTYVIASGDTMGAVAKKHGVKLSDLMAVNPGVDSRRLQIGQTVVIPSGGSAAPKSAEAAAPAAPAAPAATASSATATAASPSASEASQAPEASVSAPVVPVAPVAPAVDAAAPEAPIVPVEAAVPEVPVVETVTIEEL